MNLNTDTPELRETHLPQKPTRRETSLTQTERTPTPTVAGSSAHQLLAIMVKEEEIMAEAGGRGGYMDLLGLGEDDYLLCLSPSSYFTSSVVSATTTTTAAAASSPTSCASYLDLAPAYQYHHMLSFAGAGQEQQYHGDGVVLSGFQYHGGGGDHAIPPQKSSPTTECSSSVSSMSSSPPATAISAVSWSKPQVAFKKKGSRSSGQRKAASAAAADPPPPPPAAAGGATNKRPRVRRERLGERILALQQLVSPFGKSDTASVLHEALGYIRFLHDQVQVLSSPYMQRQRAFPSAHVPESAAGTVVEPQPPTLRASDLRSRGLCLVPVSCTEHLAGSNSHGGNGADLWSVAAGMGKAANKGAAGAGMLLPGGGGHPRQGHLA